MGDDFKSAGKSGPEVGTMDSHTSTSPQQFPGSANMAIDKSQERVRQMFAAIATRYDLMNHLLSLNVDKYWRWRTVRMVRPDGNAPILDLCTGTGDLALAYWKAGKGRIPIVAADFCLEMLSVGCEKQKKGGIDNDLTFVNADALDLPFESNSFQIVSVAFGLRNVADTMRGLGEMSRVCRPGGQVAVLEFSMPRWQPLRAIYAWYFRRVLPRIGQWIARNEQSAYSYLPESVGEFASGKELVNMMEQAGLRHVRFFPLTMGIATLYVGKK